MDPLQEIVKSFNQVTQQINQTIQHMFSEPEPENSYRQSLRESTEPMGEIHGPGIRGERLTWLFPPAKEKKPSIILSK
jgi:hypothetical protein